MHSPIYLVISFALGLLMEVGLQMPFKESCGLAKASFRQLFAVMIRAGWVWMFQMTSDVSCMSCFMASFHWLLYFQKYRGQCNTRVMADLLHCAVCLLLVIWGCWLSLAETLVVEWVGLPDSFMPLYSYFFTFGDEVSYHKFLFWTF